MPQDGNWISSYFGLQDDMSAIERYLDLGERRIYQKGDAILPLGGLVDRFIYLKHGRAGRLITTAGGAQKYIKIVGDRGIIGEVVFFQRSVSEFTFEAIAPCECYLFDRATVENVFLKDDAIVHALIQWFCHRMVSLNAQVADGLREDAYHRVGTFLEDYVRTFGSQNDDGTWYFQGKLSHYDIAKYTGINRVSVTRAIGRLQEEGVLYKDRYNLVIYDMDYLEDL